MLFYVHSEMLSLASTNAFGGIIDPVTSPTVYIPMGDLSDVLHVVLSTAYHLDIPPQFHAWTTLAHAVSSMLTCYAQNAPVPGDALFVALLAHVHRPGGPQDVYALAGQFDIEPLAIASSEHLLSIFLPEASAAWSMQVGAVYMKRLYFLQLGRIEALKRIVLKKPVMHAPEVACGQREMQRDVLGPWTLAIAQLIIDARPDVPGASIEAKLNPIAYRASCAHCGEAIRRCISAIAQEWAAVKKTI
ncbi:hypothetical protein AURDEDRAFT_164025 [Auricularia subglabra TFB-10046 SS5]|nr:hypothetical protein AURDEDRAFT_164025 [Auricularia subglabra TFB-10046 SS5]